MPVKFTLNEKKLIDHAKKTIVKYNKMRSVKGGVDTLYSFLLSDSGQIYDGACFEPNIGQATIYLWRKTRSCQYDYAGIIQSKNKEYCGGRSCA